MKLLKDDSLKPSIITLHVEINFPLKIFTFFRKNLSLILELMNLCLFSFSEDFVFTISNIIIKLILLLININFINEP